MRDAYVDTPQGNDMTEFLKIEKDGHILWVTLNRPERRNALSTPICHGLIDLPAQVEADMDIRCVVITGAGEGFCSGADLKERKEGDETARWNYVELVDNALLDIEKIPVPVISAVNGHALGGGTELALGCDIRLAVKHADFGLTETGIGIIPTGSIVRLLRDGYDALNSLLTYTAGRFSAAQMLEMGFIQQVADDVPQLMDRTNVLARQIAQNAPLALRAAKKVKRTLSLMKTTEAMESAETIRRTLDGTSDCLEGLAAFAEKREPIFIGK